MLKTILLDDCNYANSIRIIFDLMKNANEEQMPELNKILNEMLATFYSEHKYNIARICKDIILDNIIVAGVIDSTLIDIPEWCIPDEKSIYKKVTDRCSFINYLNLYNRFWSKEKAIKEITTKMKHIKITKNRYTIPQMYEHILSRVEFADVEVYNELEKRYNSINY